MLEAYSLRWKVQRIVLTAGYHLLLRGPDALGISALPPSDYAERFTAFMVHEVLQLPPASLPVMRNGLFADGAAGLQKPAASLPAYSLRRWRRLWQRRRRGLVKLRIEGDRLDHIRRIEEVRCRLRAVGSRLCSRLCRPRARVLPSAHERCRHGSATRSDAWLHSPLTCSCSPRAIASRMQLEAQVAEWREEWDDRAAAGLQSAARSAEPQ